MSESKSVYIFGYSGHAYVIIDSLLALGYTIVGYFDSKEAASNPFELRYLGCESQVDINSIVKKDLVFPAVGDNIIRNKIVDFFQLKELNQFTLIDPSANVSRWASIGKSTYVGKSVMVNAKATISNGVILNTGCVIEHECKIEKGVHIAPGSILCGNVFVDKLTFVGARTVVIPNIKINENIVIGAGSVVVNNLIEKGLYYGNPSKLNKSI